VEALAGQERSQEEFFHAFNALYDARRQIVLASRRMPRELEQIDPRLTSRFGQGLVADLAFPDPDLRVSLLQALAERTGLALPEEVTQWIAMVCPSGARELQGAWFRVAAQSALTGQALTLALAQEALAPLLRCRAEQITVEAIQRVVAHHYSVPVAELRGRRRTRPISQARQLAMYLARKLCQNGAGQLSYQEIARRFGGKNHTSAITACRKTAERLVEDAALARHVRALEDQLTGWAVREALR